jgi:hypothetical protein
MGYSLQIFIDNINYNEKITTTSDNFTIDKWDNKLLRN